MEITMFKYPGCPYCRQAEQVMEELLKEHPEYASIQIRRIDETENSELAGQYDYYYTPAFFNGKNKLYEANRSYSEKDVKEKLNQMFAALTAKK